MTDTFTKIPFPSSGDIVYIIGICYDSNFYPFYVGKSSRHIGRFGDYISANFSASTDFKVGEAIRYLKKLNYKIVIEYKESENIAQEEKELIKKHRKKLSLLNDINGYDYKKAIEKNEKDKIHNFMDDFLRKL